MYSRLATVNRIILSCGQDIIPGKHLKAKQESQLPQFKLMRTVSRLAQHLTSNGLIVIILPYFEADKAIEYVNHSCDYTTDWALELRQCSASKYYKELMHQKITVYHHPITQDNREISILLRNSFIANGANALSDSIPDTASKQGTLAWVRKVKMLSHVVEIGHTDEANFNEYSDFYASTIAKGICKALGINFLESQR